jgi:hypothetical protein
MSFDFGASDQEKMLAFAASYWHPVVLPEYFHTVGASSLD